MNTHQAADTAWPHKSNMIVLINPAKKREIKIVAALMLAAMTLLLFPPDPAPITNWLGRTFFAEEFAAMPNAMNKLALEGKPDAIIWAFKNDPTQDAKARLEALAKTGNAEALFLMAKATHVADPALAEEYFQKSIAAGYPPAVKWNLDKLRREAKDGQ